MEQSKNSTNRITNSVIFYLDISGTELGGDIVAEVAGLYIIPFKHNGYVNKLLEQNKMKHVCLILLRSRV